MAVVVDFFRERLGEEDLNTLIRDDGWAERPSVVSSYNGFIVAKPLPESIIGRTVLSTYPPDGDRRHYPCVRAYDVNFFGVPLRVMSLAFQEQDTVLAACATVALWSCFHKTIDVFGSPSPTPSPALITTHANEHLHPSRTFPSRGLQVEQICSAIIRSGLEPEVIDISDSIPVPSIMYGYVSFGAPILLGVEIEGIGMHAVSVTGYAMGTTPSVPSEGLYASVSVPSRAIRITEFYAHDDQIGPFCRMKVVPASPGTGPSPVLFRGSWRDRESGNELRLTPRVIIVPVYPKVRLNYLDIYVWLRRLSDFLDVFATDSSGRVIPMEWDTQLATSNSYKHTITEERGVSREDAFKTRVMNHPRFIWRARLSSDDHVLMDILFDATGNHRSLPAYHVVWHDDAFRGLFENTVSEPVLKETVRSILGYRFLEYLCRSCASV